MKTSTIEDLAYLIREAKENNSNKPIVFLGAGASRSGEIPLANEIVRNILDLYKCNPKIVKHTGAGKAATYPALMECLTPSERNKLLKEYIDRAKINVTHIYLAQLMKKGYIDYVLTVNFDDLMLRALALYNEFPPTYDMAVLKDLTTTTFKEKSVVYLHGQHHGLWLLNTEEELKKVREFIPPILHAIKDRLWIFIGYSGEDPIFGQIVQLGRFDKGLYWVAYRENLPGETVRRELLDKENTNSFLIGGHDADSFMITLNNELKLPQPLIIEKPFTSLLASLENIVDIEDKEPFKGVRQRLEIVKKQVGTAIDQFELGKVKTKKSLVKEMDTDLLKKRIIDIMVKKEFDEKEISTLEETAAGSKDSEIPGLLADLYLSWGNEVYDSAKSKDDTSVLLHCAEKFEKATALDPQHAGAFSNWGVALSELAELKNDETLFNQSIEKFEKATELNPQHADAFYNWGKALSDLAELKNDETLFNQSFEKYEKATALNPQYANAFNNWGYALLKLGSLKNNEALFRQSIEKCKTSISLGGSSYNLACAYALLKEKGNAFESLENCLKKNEVSVPFVEKDSDWEAYRDDPDFIALLDKYHIQKQA